MKKKRALTIVMIFVLIAQIAAEALTLAALLRLNMLPGKYIAAIVALLVIHTIGTGLIMFARGKKKRRIGKVRRIVACLLVLLTVIASSPVIKFATDAYRTVSVVTNKVSTSNRNVYVFVLVEDPAKSIAEAKDYTFGLVENYDVKHTEKAVEKISQMAGKNITTVNYQRAMDMVKDLYEKKVGALIMNGASVALLLEEPDYETFTEKVRILTTMPYSTLEDAPKPTEPKPTEPPEPVDVTNTPFVVYISGSDTRSSMLTVSRSDVNILAVVNPETKQVLLINTPRDYYVANPEGDGAMDKLTHCGLYGPECSMEALEGLYDLKIDYYGQINFTGFEKLVDAVGGVTIYSDQSFKARDTYITVGENHLNGAEALDYSRERYHVAGGDNGRGKNQMKIIKGVIEKMTSGTTVISNYSAILQSLEGMFSTSMEMSDISMLVKMQLSDMAKWNIQSFAVTGVGGSERTYSAPGDFAYVMHEDENSTAYAAELAARVIAGEKLTEADMKLPK